MSHYHVLIAGCGSIGEHHLRRFQRTSRAAVVTSYTVAAARERMAQTSGVTTSGKVFLQFGGSGLLGRALVSALAEAGATLVVASRKPGVLMVDATEAKLTGHQIHLETVDLPDESSITAFVARVIKSHGFLDGMVYNAVSRTMSGMGDTLAQWEDSMRVNATGFFAAVRARGDARTAKKSGSIVHISSEIGTVGMNPFLYEGTPTTVAPDYFFTRAA